MYVSIWTSECRVPSLIRNSKSPVRLLGIRQSLVNTSGTNSNLRCRSSRRLITHAPFLSGMNANKRYIYYNGSDQTSPQTLAITYASDPRAHLDLKDRGAVRPGVLVGNFLVGGRRGKGQLNESLGLQSKQARTASTRDPPKTPHPAPDALLLPESKRPERDLDDVVGERHAAEAAIELARGRERGDAS